MKLVFIEFITGGGLNNELLPSSLVTEGEAMYQAILHDLQSYEYIDIVTTRDPRFDSPTGIPRCLYDADIWTLWHDLMKECDAALLIAPETDGILLRLTEMAENCDCQLIGSNSEAVSLCADKYQTLTLLKQNDIPVVSTSDITETSFLNNQPVVLKPNDGAGAEGCRLIENEQQLQQYQQDILDESSSTRWIVQNYIEGIQASMTLCCSRKGVDVLAVNEQLIEIDEDGIFKLKGIRVNALHHLQNRCQTLAEKIITLIPGLHGVVGIDFILRDEEIYVLEINPRPVSSYVTLRRSILRNPLAALFERHYSIPHVCDRRVVALDFSNV